MGEYKIGSDGKLHGKPYATVRAKKNKYAHWYYNGGGGIQVSRHVPMSS